MPLKSLPKSWFWLYKFAVKIFWLPNCPSRQPPPSSLNAFTKIWTQKSTLLISTYSKIWPVSENTQALTLTNLFSFETTTNMSSYSQPRTVSEDQLESLPIFQILLELLPIRDCLDIFSLCNTDSPF